MAMVKYWESKPLTAYTRGYVSKQWLLISVVIIALFSVIVEMARIHKWLNLMTISSPKLN